MQKTQITKFIRVFKELVYEYNNYSKMLKKIVNFTKQVNYICNKYFTKI